MLPTLLVPGFRAGRSQIIVAEEGHKGCGGCLLIGKLGLVKRSEQHRERVYQEARRQLGSLGNPQSEAEWK